MKRAQTLGTRDYADDSDVLGFSAFPSDIYLFIIKYTDLWEHYQEQAGNDIGELYRFYKNLVELKTIWMNKLQVIRVLGLYLEAIQELTNARIAREQVNFSRGLNSAYPHSILTALDDAIYKLQRQAINIWIISSELQAKWSRRISEIMQTTKDPEKIKSTRQLSMSIDSVCKQNIVGTRNTVYKKNTWGRNSQLC